MTWSFGTAAGSSTKKVQVGIEFRVKSRNNNNALVQYRTCFRVTKGSFGKTEVSGDWGAVKNAKYTKGNKKYGITGWMDLGYCDYGKEVTRSASASFKVGSREYKSTVVGRFTPKTDCYPKSAENIVLSQGDGNEIDISWNITSIPRYAPTSIVVWIKAQGAKSYTKAKTIDGTDTSCTILGKVSSTNYIYLQSVNSKGTTNSTVKSIFVNPDMPESPSDAEGEVTSDSSIAVSWIRHVSSAAPWDSITIQRNVDDAGSWQTIQTISQGNNGENYDGVKNTFVDNACGIGRKYKYRFRSTNHAGNSDWVYTDYIYMRPTAPSMPVPARKSVEIVELTFKNPTSYADETEIQRSTNRTTWETIAELSGHPTFYEDSCGIGLFYYRVRAKKDDLESSWSPISTASTASEPLAPTLLNPAQGAVIDASSVQYVEVRFAHNTVDGSAMTAFQVEYGNNDSDLVTETINSSSPVCRIPIAGLLNTTVKWRVRTKGVIDKWSDPSEFRTFRVLTPPAVGIESPEYGMSVSTMPLEFVVQYDDLSGELVALSLTATSDDTSETFDVTDFEVEGNRQDGPQTVRFSIDKRNWIPDDKTKYNIELAARSDSGLTGFASTSIETNLILPQRTSLSIAPDVNNGTALLTVYVNEASDGTEVDDVSVWRIVDGNRQLVADGLINGQSIVDYYAPLNKEFTYLTVAYAASGIFRSVEHKGKIRSVYAIFVMVDRNIARLKWNPSFPMNIDRPSRQTTVCAGRKYPVSSDLDNVSETCNVAGTVKSVKEKEAFKALIRDEGKCVYKSLDGEVFWVQASGSFTPSSMNANRCDIAMNLTRISGDL